MEKMLFDFLMRNCYRFGIKANGIPATNSLTIQTETIWWYDFARYFRFDAIRAYLVDLTIACDRVRCPKRLNLFNEKLHMIRSSTGFGIFFKNVRILCRSSLGYVQSVIRVRIGIETNAVESDLCSKCQLTPLFIGQIYGI